MINRPGVRGCMNISESDKPRDVNINAYLFHELSPRSIPDVRVRVIAATAGENKRARIVAKMQWAAAEVDFDAAFSVANKSDSRSRDWFHHLSGGNGKQKAAQVIASGVDNDCRFFVLPAFLPLQLSASFGFIWGLQCPR